LNTSYSYEIYANTAQLPKKWNDLAIKTIFLSKEYLEVLEKSAPKNMTCHFIGIFENQELIGIALSQFLDLNKLTSFGERDKCIKTYVRNFLLKNFSSHVLIIGNNMLTGQNAYYFSKKNNETEALKTLQLASEQLKKDFKSAGKKIHITIFKDFFTDDFKKFNIPAFKNYNQFSTQPNMVFEIKENWKSEQDYIDNLSKKYRDQYKRARKKSNDIHKQKMHLDDIIKHEEEINKMYHHVAKNAPFNTFFLSKNHFRIFKAILKDKFLFYGYFLDEKLIGFNTLIKNGEVLDTYFLGYDDKVQRDKMLYLNMLYDMVAYSINKNFKEIIFSRTALEIKSSIGAKPEKMFGLLAHTNPLINKFFIKIFHSLEPETIWHERNPFKE